MTHPSLNRLVTTIGEIAGFAMSTGTPPHRPEVTRDRGKPTWGLEGPKDYGGSSFKPAGR